LETKGRKKKKKGDERHGGFSKGVEGREGKRSWCLFLLPPFLFQPQRMWGKRKGEGVTD